MFFGLFQFGLALLLLFVPIQFDLVSLFVCIFCVYDLLVCLFYCYSSDGLTETQESRVIFLALPSSEQRCAPIK